ncbi:MAG: hypothetical protein M1825_005144 [Sarcosagium campestre]|nr:MAG: hypothetical protein M1825_005144 [Sarcosagium campestre]
MDVHRCRFIPYPPSAINALAFSHPSSLKTRIKAPRSLRLAIGKANGDIEIWNPLGGAWLHETTLRGGKERSIDGLVWTQDPPVPDGHNGLRPGRLRLFSIGYSTHVSEWDLELGRPIQHTGGNHAEIWCLTAQPRTPILQFKLDKETGNVQKCAELAGQDLAVGCTDGAVVLLSTTDGELKYKGSLARPSKKKARVLSIAYQNAFTIVAGCADSTIRIFDTRTKQMTRQMSLGPGPAGGPRETLVWAIKCLPNGGIVSGDSAGELRFWDGKTYALHQRIKSHEADVLSVETSVDGSTVFSGGMDRRTIVYKRTGPGGGGKAQSRWAALYRRRFHTHDVKSMASFEGGQMSVIISGGLDTVPIVMPLREYEKEHHRKLTGIPREAPLQSAPAKRLIMSWWDRQVQIWRISETASENITYDELQGAGAVSSRKCVAKISLKGENSITSASLSNNGDLLAVSTIAQVKLFRLRLIKKRDESPPGLSKVNTSPYAEEGGAKLVRISPDSRWMATVSSENVVRMFRIDPIDGKAVSSGFVLERLRRDLDALVDVRLDRSLGGYERVITDANFSADGRIFTVGDLLGYVDSWLLEGYEDEGDPNIDTDIATKSRSHSAGSESEVTASSSDEEAVDRDRSVIAKTGRYLFGQRWVPNPTAFLIPKLPSSIIILCFRPPRSSKGGQDSTMKPSLHPTRQTPHPHSHDVPAAEGRIAVVTASREIFEFDILSGTLSAWSRRNPPSTFPASYGRVMDLPKGCFWDVSMNRERLWVYGVNWLCMFDLSQDLSPQAGDVQQREVTKKRKLESGQSRLSENRVDPLSGAGGKVPKAELGTGIGKKMKKSSGVTGKGEVISFDTDYGIFKERAEDAEITEGELLKDLRRKLPRPEIQTEATGENLQGGVAIRADGNEMQSASRGPAFWRTLKYQPILGMVPLMSYDSQGRHLLTPEGSEVPCEAKLEIVLVERPLDEVNLPARWEGNQEWGDKDF